MVSLAECEGPTDALNQVQTSAITEQNRPNAINPSPVEDPARAGSSPQIPKPAAQTPDPPHAGVPQARSLKP
ncbi:hypothetical protein TM233_50280 [Bradyrhizobium sp. TM233]|nr:hypothetical protein TM233_50280 [Bradyrhizobium sp. TM233]